MSKLTWDNEGKRVYQSGVDRGVVYPKSRSAYRSGVAWNGLISVDEKISGGESTAIYADNIKYLNLISSENLNLSIECYDYPPEIDECLGKRVIAAGVTIGDQATKYFGFSYRTLIGNDTEGNSYSYDIHLVFTCLPTPPENNSTTNSSNPSALTKTLEVSTLPVYVSENKTTCKITFRRRKFVEAGLRNIFDALEKILYGTDTSDPRVPEFTEISDMFAYHPYIQDSTGSFILDNNGSRLESYVI